MQAAVGSDTVAWECVPPVNGELMHPLILSGLGLPLGELRLGHENTIILTSILLQENCLLLMT